MDAAASARLIDLGASVRPGKFSLEYGPLSAIPLANGKSSTIGRMFLKQFRMGFSRSVSLLLSGWISEVLCLQPKFETWGTFAASIGADKEEETLTVDPFSATHAKQCLPLWLTGSKCA